MSMIQIYGASGHAKVVLDCLLSQGVSEFYIIDDDSRIKSILNFEVHQTHKAKPIQSIIAIGNNYTRQKISQTLDFNYTKAIHKTALVSNFSSIDKGSVVFAYAVVNANSKIGQHCIINTSAVVEHDCIVNDYVHISPNATLCGGVSVGELSQVGAGAVVNPGVSIGKNSIIGAGAVVTKDVPDNVVVVGNPAKVIKTINKKI
ncbi:acetyltransferase [Flavobacterium sp. CS20]|nr:acetyltransferase [Flavobacterium sp. CS20]